MNGYEKMSRYIENRRERLFRDYMRQRFGTGKYRITREYEVHAYGLMPNTNQKGWFLFGHYPAVALETVG